MYNYNELNAVELSPTKKDYYQIWNELLEVSSKLSERWNPAATNESDPGVVLLKVLTAIADKLSYNIDANTLEAFMPSAAQESSMRKLCEMLGYSMRFYMSATTSARVTYQGDIFPADTGSIHIEKFTNLKDTDKTVNYITLEDIVLNASKRSQVVECIEGELITCETSMGTRVTLEHLDDNYRFYLPERQVASNGIFVTNMAIKNAEPWTKVDNLNTCLLGEPVFKFGYDSAMGLPYLEFPEDIGTLIGTGLEIKFIRTKGVQGNIAVSTLKTMEKPLSWSAVAQSNDSLSAADLAGESTESSEDWKDVELYTVTNITAARDGKDPETIDEAYWNFQKEVGTFDTLVTCRDYMNKIYQMTQTATSSNPLVSNSIVSDVRDDINRAYTLCQMTDSGVEYKNMIHKDKDGKDKMTYFDLMLYPFVTVNGLNTQTEYVTSFTYTDQQTFNIIQQLEENKTIAHNFLSPNKEEIACVKVYFQLSARMSATSKVTALEATEIELAAHRALYKDFNMRNMSFGEELPFDLILESLEGADPRIKNVSLDDPKMYVSVCTVDGKEYPITGDYIFTNLADAEKARDFYMELVLRNVLAGKISLFNYYNDFVSTISDSTYPAGKAATSSSASKQYIDPLNAAASDKLMMNPDATSTELAFEDNADFKGLRKMVYLNTETGSLKLGLTLANNEAEEYDLRHIVALLKELSVSLYEPGASKARYKILYTPKFAQQTSATNGLDVTVYDLATTKIYTTIDGDNYSLTDLSEFFVASKICVPAFAEDAIGTKTPFDLCLIPLNKSGTEVTFDKVVIEASIDTDNYKTGYTPDTIGHSQMVNALSRLRVTVDWNDGTDLDLDADTTIEVPEFNLEDNTIKEAEVDKPNMTIMFNETSLEDDPEATVTGLPLKPNVTDSDFNEASFIIKTYNKGNLPITDSVTFSLNNISSQLLQAEAGGQGPISVGSFLAKSSATAELGSHKATLAGNIIFKAYTNEIYNTTAQFFLDCEIIDKTLQVYSAWENNGELVRGSEIFKEILRADIPKPIIDNFVIENSKVIIKVKDETNEELTQEISFSLSFVFELIKSQNSNFIRNIYNLYYSLGSKTFEALDLMTIDKFGLECDIQFTGATASQGYLELNASNFNIVDYYTDIYFVENIFDVWRYEVRSRAIYEDSSKPAVTETSPMLQDLTLTCSTSGIDKFTVQTDISPWPKDEESKDKVAMTFKAGEAIKEKPVTYSTFLAAGDTFVTLADTENLDLNNLEFISSTDKFKGEGASAQGLPAPTKMTADFLVNTEHISADEPLKLAAKEVIQFRAPNFKTSMTYPAYVNYYLKLNPNTSMGIGVSQDAVPATMQTLLEFFDGGMTGYVETDTWNKEISWATKVKSFPSESSLPTASRLMQEQFKSEQDKVTAGNPTEAALRREYERAVKKCGTIFTKGIQITYGEKEKDDQGKYPPTITTLDSDTYYVFSPKVKTDPAASCRIPLPSENGGNAIVFYGMVLTSSNFNTLVQWLQGTMGKLPYQADVYSGALDDNGLPVVLEGEKLIKGLYSAGRSNMAKQPGSLVDLAHCKYTLLNSFPTGKELSEIYVPRLWPTDTNEHTTDGLGRNASTKGVPANAEYALRKGEYLLITYSSSEGREDGTAVVKNVAHGEGTILKANFEMIGSEDLAKTANYNKTSGFGPWTLPDKSVILSAELGGEVAGMFTLGATDQIEIREKIEVTLDGATTLLYWELKNQQRDGSGYEHFPRGKYILQPGEYLYYTDAAQESMAYYGSGTEIELGTFTPNIKRHFSKNKISAELINELGMVSAIPWTTVNLSGNGAAITIKEHQYINLIEGDSLESISLNGLDKTLTSEFKRVNNATYISAGLEASLPVFLLEDCYWEGRSKLELMMNQKTPQTLTVHQTSTGLEIARDIIYLWGVFQGDNAASKTQVYTPLLSVADNQDTLDVTTPENELEKAETPIITFATKDGKPLDTSNNELNEYNTWQATYGKLLEAEKQFYFEGTLFTAVQKPYIDAASGTTAIINVPQQDFYFTLEGIEYEVTVATDYNSYVSPVTIKKLNGDSPEEDIIFCIYNIKDKIEDPDQVETGKTPVPLALYSTIDIIDGTGEVSFFDADSSGKLKDVSFKACKTNTLMTLDGQVFAEQKDASGFSQLILSSEAAVKGKASLDIHTIIPDNCFGLLTIYYQPAGEVIEEAVIIPSYSATDNQPRLSIFNYAPNNRDSWWLKADGIENVIEPTEDNLGSQSRVQYKLRTGTNTIKIPKSCDISILAKASNRSAEISEAVLQVGELKIIPKNRPLNPKLAFSPYGATFKLPISVIQSFLDKELSRYTDTKTLTDDNKVDPELTAQELSALDTVLEEIKGADTVTSLETAKKELVRLLTQDSDILESLAKASYCVEGQRDYLAELEAADTTTLKDLRAAQKDLAETEELFKELKQKYLDSLFVIRRVVDTDYYGLFVKEEDVLKRIIELDSDYNFFYTMEISDSYGLNLTEADPTDTLLVAKNWFDSQNINNKFVVSEIDVDYLTNYVAVSKFSRS